MAQHEASTPSASDTVLREIAQKERELQEELTRAQHEAARLVDDARREAEVIRDRARKQAQHDADAASAATAADVHAIHEQVLAKAGTEAAALRQRAEGRMNAAVALVAREVLGASA